MKALSEGVSGESCKVAIMPLDVPKPRGPLLIFGEYFLKKYYTVFDKDEMVIGFADANQEEEVGHIANNTPYQEVNYKTESVEVDITQEIIFKAKHEILNRDDFLLINP
jgi:hypothetical protein